MRVVAKGRILDAFASASKKELFASNNWTRFDQFGPCSLNYISKG